MFTYPMGFWELIDQGVWPINIPYSSLIETSYSSSQPVATDCTIALGFKPTNASTTPLNDMTGHYLLTIQKQGSTVKVWKQGVQLADYGGAMGSSYAEFVQNVLTSYAGSYHGYYSRLVVVEYVLEYSDFWEPADIVTGLWRPKKVALADNIAPDPTFTQDGTAGGWVLEDGYPPVISGGVLTANSAGVGNAMGPVVGVESARYLIKYVVNSISIGSIQAFTVLNNTDGTTTENYGTHITTAGTHFDIIETDADSVKIGANFFSTDAVVSELSIYDLSTGVVYGEGGCLLNFDNALNLGEDSSWKDAVGANIAPDPTFAQDGTAGGWTTNGPTIANGVADFSTSGTWTSIGFGLGSTGPDGKRFLLKTVVQSISYGSVRTQCLPLDSDGSETGNVGQTITNAGTYYDIIELDADSNGIYLAQPSDTDAKVSECFVYELTDQSYSGPNNWTIAGTQTLDTPTNNYATLNPTHQRLSRQTLSNGNLVATQDGGSGNSPVFSTMGASSGKFYFEGKLTTVGGDYPFIGLSLNNSGNIPANTGVTYFTNVWYGNGNIAQNDVIGLAFNIDTGTYEFFKNGVSLGGGGFGLGSDGIAIPVISSVLTGVWEMNFGTIGFTHTPPAGYKALCHANLQEPTVLKSDEVASLVLRLGTGANASVSSLPFQPDFVNIKTRDRAQHWGLFDSVQASGHWLETSTTGASQTTAAEAVTFTANGYDLGSGQQFNFLNDNFLDLAMKAGTDQGFEIIKRSGGGGSAYVAHTLGKTPTYIIGKCLGSPPTYNAWHIWHKHLAVSQVLGFTTGAAYTDDNAFAESTNPPSATHFGVGPGMNQVGYDYVFYLFTDSDVFKAFSYIGNASTTGPFVNLGGRPLGVPFLKNSAIASGWYNLDSARDPFNVIEQYLFPNASNAEGTSQWSNFTSQGFNVIGSGPGYNGSGNLFIGLAIMESTKYSNAF